jgi:hypothetical protein
VRKKYLLGALVGVLALAVAAVAIASPQFKQTAKIKYSTKKGKRAAGLNLTVEATDPGAQPPGNQPGATKVTLKFRGAKTNTKAGKQCKLPKSQAANCPANTKIGSGTALANVVGTNPNTGQTTVTGPLNNTVTIYLANKAVYLVIKGTTLPTTVILKSALTKSGKLTTNVKRDVPALPGGNRIVLTKLTAKVKRVRKGRGRKQKALFRTPKCGRSKRFKIRAEFQYDDGTRKNLNLTQKCSK